AANLIDGKDFQLRSGELERQRYSVEAPADLGYSPDVCVIEAKLRHHIGRALDEELDRFSVPHSFDALISGRRHRQRSDREHALAGDAKSFAAGREKVQARGRAAQPLRKRDTRVEQVLAVVQYEQRTAIGKVSY